MNDASKLYDDQAKELSMLINKYTSAMERYSSDIADAAKLYELGEFVNYKKFTVPQHKIRILSKRIKECASSISYFADKIEYEESDFKDSINMIKYRAEIVSDNLPHVSRVGSDIRAVILVRNVGLETWTKENVRLNVGISKDDTFIDKEYEFTFDESSVKLGEYTLFNVVLRGLVSQGVYSVQMCVKNNVYNFDTKKSKTIYVS